MKAMRIAMPSLGTGYGPLTVREFAEALRPALRRDWSPVSRPVVVLRHSADVEALREVMGRAAN